jgi:hypothetical protein
MMKARKGQILEISFIQFENLKSHLLSTALRISIYKTILAAFPMGMESGFLL